MPKWKCRISPETVAQFQQKFGACEMLSQEWEVEASSEEEARRRAIARMPAPPMQNVKLDAEGPEYWGEYWIECVYDKD